MKMMKWALLGSAALAVTATAARADDLADLKAQIEALQNRVSQLEAQPQASMPSGYSMLAIRDGQGTYEGIVPERYADRVREESGFTLSVMPTADVAPVAEVSVSGEIRTALIYTDRDEKFDDHLNIEERDNSFDDDDSNLDVAVRGRIFIRGKVDTAVGEVGGYFRLQASGGGINGDFEWSDYSSTVRANKAYGWWKFAPEWELMAGYNDATGSLQVGWDWVAATGPTFSFGPTNISNEQLRLTYTSGPVAFAISLEDPDYDTPPFTTEQFNDDDGNEYVNDVPAIESYLMYSSDVFTAQIAGLYQIANEGDDDWAIGGGGTVGIMEGFQLTAGAVIGEGTSQYANNAGPATLDDEFWAASAGLLANLSEDTRIELGVGYEDYDKGGTALGFGGGIYWDPVSQLTLGAGATYVEREYNEFPVTGPGGPPGDDGDYDVDTLQVFFGTWLRFP